MGLTEKQQRFVEEYLLDLNATQAAIRAGYSSHTANEQGARLLANVSVKEAVMDGIERRTERTEITQDWVVQRLALNVEMAQQATPVLDSKGNPTGEYVFQGNVANKALELLGKHVGLFKEPPPPSLDDDVKVHIYLPDNGRCAPGYGPEKV